LYPALGPLPKKDECALKDGKIYKVLGHKGILLYKQIFDANNKQTVKEFLEDPFIIQLWPIFCKLIDED
jgi:hypothetical protein